MFTLKAGDAVILTKNISVYRQQKRRGKVEQSNLKRDDLEAEIHIAGAFIQTEKCHGRET